jgi:hypothetical protein
MTPNPLAMYADRPPLLCCGCYQPRQIDWSRVSPGVIAYLPCECGGTGIYDPKDNYVEIHRKRVNKLPYERSTTRGGKLIARKAV